MIKFVINKSGVRELLKSNELQQECRDYAERIQRMAGEGFITEDRNYPERSGAAVRPETEEAYYRNLNDHILEKVMGDVD